VAVRDIAAAERRVVVCELAEAAPADTERRVVVRELAELAGA